MSDRLPNGLRHELRVMDMPIIHEEVDEIDFDNGVRKFPTLSSWKNVFDKLSIFHRHLDNHHYGDGLALYHMASRVELGDSPPRIPMYAECTHIVCGSGRLSLAFVPEIAQNNYYSIIRYQREVADRMYNRLVHEFWSPSEALGSGVRGLSERNVIIANRLFVLASPSDCADTLATMAMLSI